MIRKPLTTSDEFDALTRFKRYISYRAGQRSKIKKLYRRKERKWLNKLLLEDANINI